MLIKPFKSLEKEDYMNAKSVRTDIYYAPSYDNTLGKTIIIKSYLVNDLTSKITPTYVKLIYIFCHKCEKDIKSANELKENDFDLRCNYLITTLYDEDPEIHYFNISICEINPNGGQTIHSIYDNNQNIKELFRTIRMIPTSEYEISKNMNNSIGLMIESEDPMKFKLVRGIGKNYNLRKINMIKIHKKISDFLKTNNVSFHSISMKYLKEELDSYNTERLLNISQKIYADNNGLTASTEDKVFINDYLIKKNALDDFASSLIKPSLISMFDEVTMTYVNKKFTTVEINNPFNKVDKDFLVRGLMIFKQQVKNELDKITDLLGDIDLFIYLSPLYIRIRCKFDEKDIDFYEYYKIPTLLDTVMMKDDAVSRYLYDFCKSKRYKHNKMFERYSDTARVNELLEYFNDEGSWINN